MTTETDKKQLGQLQRIILLIIFYNPSRWTTSSDIREELRDNTTEMSPTAMCTSLRRLVVRDLVVKNPFSKGQYQLSDYGRESIEKYIESVTNGD
jgi:predicted transcriptional regulator